MRDSLAVRTETEIGATDDIVLEISVYFCGSTCVLTATVSKCKISMDGNSPSEELGL